MGNIKDRFNNILKEINRSCSLEQEIIILNILKFLQNKKIDISILPQEHLAMFINHLLVLFSRLDSNEILEMEYLDIMFAELKKESVDISREVILIINELYNNKISESEVFLVATHVENMLNQ